MLRQIQIEIPINAAILSTLDTDVHSLSDTVLALESVVRTNVAKEHSF